MSCFTLVYHLNYRGQKTLSDIQILNQTLNLGPTCEFVVAFLSSIVMQLWSVRQPGMCLLGFSMCVCSLCLVFYLQSGSSSSYNKTILKLQIFHINTFFVQHIQMSLQYFKYCRGTGHQQIPVPSRQTAVTLIEQSHMQQYYTEVEPLYISLRFLDSTLGP